MTALLVIKNLPDVTALSPWWLHCWQDVSCCHISITEMTPFFGEKSPCYYFSTTVISPLLVKSLSNTTSLSAWWLHCWWKNFLLPHLYHHWWRCYWGEYTSYVLVRASFLRCARSFLLLSCLRLPAGSKCRSIWKACVWCGTCSLSCARLSIQFIVFVYLTEIYIPSKTTEPRYPQNLL